MKLGSRFAISLTISPSTTYKGSDVPFDEKPRTRIVGDAPGWADVVMRVTPAVFPWRAWPADVIVLFSMSLELTEEIAPVRSLFFWTP